MTIPGAATTGFQLHSPLWKCETNDVEAPSGGYTQGQMVKINDVVCIAMTAASAGDQCAMLVKAPMVTVPCLEATTGYYADKEKVYFDESEAEVTQESSGNTLCGHVVQDSALGDEEVMISLDGTLGIVS